MRRYSLRRSPDGVQRANARMSGGDRGVRRTGGTLRAVAALLGIFLLALPPSLVVPAASPLAAANRPGWDTSYGNDHFGHWLVDRFGLPAFEYTIDEATDPAAIWNNSSGAHNDFWHQIGNDRVVATAFNHGYVQLWDQERQYRWSNLYEASTNHYAGGFGYVNDGSQAWSTLYSDRPAGASYRRDFGMGYVDKEEVANGLDLDQTVFAPFGNDPVLLSQITMTNTGALTRTYTYVEYWDVNPMVVTATLHGQGASIPQPIAATSFDPASRTLTATPVITPGGPTPHTLFLSSLTDPVVHFETHASAFFGRGGRALPDEVAAGRLSDSTVASPTTGAMFAMQAQVTLPPRQSHTLVYAYGYGDAGTISPLVQRLAQTALTALSSSEAAWSAAVPVLGLPRDQWLSREMAWNYYGLRSSFTSEDVWQAHLPSQGSVYQYDWGMNIAYRDPLQHALPIIYTVPSLARETLSFALRAQPQQGFIPYGFASGGIPFNSFNPGGKLYPDDADLWLLWLASEYVLATRDVTFLSQVFPYLGGTGSDTVYNHLKTAYQHQVNGVGFGPHGEFRMLSGDWGDLEGVNGATESSATTAQAAWVFQYFAQIADLMGDSTFAVQVRAQAKTLVGVTAAQWTGRWFNRGYKGSTPYGVDSLYLNTQPWAILSGAATITQAITDDNNIKTLLSQPSPIGAASESTSQGPSGEGGTGTGSTGGIWYSLNGPTVWAFAALDPALAYQEYKNNTHATYAQAYPTNWWGVLSGPDSYDSFEAGASAGQAFQMDYPVQDTHAHAWPLYDTFKLSGIQPTEAGYTINPHWPFAQFTWNTSVVGVSYGNGRVSGRLHPEGTGTVRMHVRLPASLPGSVAVYVNGAPATSTQGNGFVDWSMPVTQGQDTTWAILPAS